MLIHGGRQARASDGDVPLMGAAVRAALGEKRKRPPLLDVSAICSWMPREEPRSAGPLAAEFVSPRRNSCPLQLLRPSAPAAERVVKRARRPDGLSRCHSVPDLAAAALCEDALRFLCDAGQLSPPAAVAARSLFEPDALPNTAAGDLAVGHLSRLLAAGASLSTPRGSGGSACSAGGWQPAAMLTASPESPLPAPPGEVQRWHAA